MADNCLRNDVNGGEKVKKGRDLSLDVHELPAKIKTIVGRCEIGVISFSNDEMSVALKFGQLLHRRLTRMAEHYEKMSGHFMPEDIRGPMMAQAAKDMRHVLEDCSKDL